MGLDIGFSIYKKKKDDKGKLFLEKADFPKEKEDYSWSCGRCEVNYSWGYGYESKNGKITEVTFDKELDNYAMPQTEEEKKFECWQITLHYVPFDEYKKNVEDAINEELENGAETKRSMLSQILENKETIKELREYQKECEEDNEFAFEKWSEEIKELKDENSELRASIDHYDEEDYDVSHALSLRRMLQYLEECQKEGYVCIPWFSD